MNCCKNNNDKDGRNNQSHGMKHVLMMLLCCGLPIILVLMLPLIGIFGSGFKASIATIMPYLCPLMMILMIPMMLKSSKEDRSCCHENQSDSIKTHKNNI